jgi:Sortase and related acyltransferases
MILLDDRDINEINALLTVCDDFSMLVSGQPHQPEDAFELLHDLPPQKFEAYKQVLGIRDRNGKLCGVLDLVSGFPEKSIAFIGLLLLLPEKRGAGLGRRILQSLETWARGAGFKALMLGVVEENNDGLRFWKACGFEVVATSDPRAFGQKTQRVLRMKKVL